MDSNESCPDDPKDLCVKQCYLLECLSQQTNRIVVCDASMTGSRLGAYAKHRITSGDTIGNNTSGSTSEPTTSAQLPSSGDYRIEVKGKQVHTERFDSCSARFIHESLAVTEENCMFVLVGDRISVVATRDIPYGEQSHCIRTIWSRLPAQVATAPPESRPHLLAQVCL